MVIVRYFACTHDVVGDVIRALLGAGADMEATTYVCGSVGTSSVCSTISAHCWQATRTSTLAIAPLLDACFKSYVLGVEALLFLGAHERWRTAIETAKGKIGQQKRSGIFSNTLERRAGDRVFATI